MLRFGLLGAGRIGQVHGKNIATNPRANWSRFLIHLKMPPRSLLPRPVRRFAIWTRS